MCCYPAVLPHNTGQQKPLLKTWLIPTMSRQTEMDYQDINCHGLSVQDMEVQRYFPILLKILIQSVFKTECFINDNFNVVEKCLNVILSICIIIVIVVINSYTDQTFSLPVCVGWCMLFRLIQELQFKTKVHNKDRYIQNSWTFFNMSY